MDYNRMLDQMEKESLHFSETFNDSYDLLSGWGHGYFCHLDGGRLSFYLDKPKEHICEICGKNYEGEKYDNIFTYFYRNEAFLTILKSAVIFKERGKDEFLEILKKISLFYAEGFNKFTLHVKDKPCDDINLDIGGAGRIMPQGLNEAIILTRFIEALSLVRESLEKDLEFLKTVKENYIDNIVELLKSQIIKIHNIPMWKCCALGIVGFFFKDEELIDFAFNSEFGLYNQLKDGVTKDYFWYEGSIHYNFFILEGLTALLYHAKGYDNIGKLEHYVENMLSAAYYYAFDNIVLPNPNDGWPNVNLKTYSYIYDVAAAYYGENSIIGNLIKNIYNAKREVVHLPLSKPYFFEGISLQRLIYTKDFNVNAFEPAKRACVVYPNSFYTMLRNEKVNVFCKFGLNGPSHAHPDKMNIEVLFGNDILTRDLSNPGYGTDICNTWNRMTTSHNTVVCGLKNQTSMEGGEVLAFNETKKNVSVKTQAYNGIEYIRTLALTEDGFNDEFEVNADSETQMDYFFHCDAILQADFDSRAYTFETNEEGYQHLLDCREYIKPNNASEAGLTWTLNGRKIKSRIALPEGTSLILAKTIDNPSSKRRDTFIIRTKAKNFKFMTFWRAL